MFKYLPLLWSNLGRKRLRTWLTLASIVVAFLLFGILQTMRMALTGGADLAGVDRLMTIHKVSIIQSLPQSYLNRVRGIDGIRVAMSQNWFGGIYKEDRNQVVAFTADPNAVLRCLSRGEVAGEPEGRMARGPHGGDHWRSRRRIVSAGRWATLFRLRSNIFTRKSGGTVWDLKIVGIYEGGDNQTRLFPLRVPERVAHFRP